MEEQGYMMVIGMSVGYIASFLGLIFAYVFYRRRTSGKKEEKHGK